MIKKNLKKFTSEEGSSDNLIQENIAQLKQIFPDAFTESGLDFAVLRQLLGDVKVLKQGEEKFGLNWHGKKKARQMGLLPSYGTLRPCPQESKDWDKTQNLFIEGDNLESLKLLHRCYANKVKMIYIDPPYNTGKEFIYPDNFAEGLETYLDYTGQRGVDGWNISGEERETTGRKHSNWLSMILPRLRLARDLLRDDGVIFISIDDNEQAHLKDICDEIFGEENFIGEFVWETKRNAKGVPPTTLLMTNHEYVIAYAKDITSFKFKGLERNKIDFKNPDNDPRGLWRSENIKATGRQDNYFEIENPANGMRFYANWAFSESTIKKKIADNLILFPKTKEGRVRQKKIMSDYLNETKACVTNLGWFSTENETKKLMDLLDSKIFDFPKPVNLIKFFVGQTTSITPPPRFRASAYNT